jgi:predicted metalloprotease with PDZ domain
VLRVVEQGALQQAGLSAGDVIIAVDGIRLNQAGLDSRLLRASVGDVWRLHAFRRDELHQFEVVLQAAEANTFVLAMANPEAAERGWPVA